MCKKERVQVQLKELIEEKNRVKKNIFQNETEESSQ